MILGPLPDPLDGDDVIQGVHDQLNGVEYGVIIHHVVENGEAVGGECVHMDGRAADHAAQAEPLGDFGGRGEIPDILHEFDGSGRGGIDAGGSPAAQEGPEVSEGGAGGRTDGVPGGRELQSFGSRGCRRRDARSGTPGAGCGGQASGG